MHPLFQNTRGWDMSWLGGPFKDLKARNAAVTNYGSGSRFSPNSFVANALIEYDKGEAGAVAFIRTATNCYCAEQKHGDGSVTLFQLMANGQCKGAEVNVSGRYTPLDSIVKADQTTIMACMIMALSDEDPDAKAQLDGLPGNQAALIEAVYWFSEALYYGTKDGKIQGPVIRGGNIDLLPQQTVEAGACRGTVLAGTSTVLMCGAASAATAKATKIADAKALFKDWADKQSWSKEERELIPSFSDDFPVLPEVIRMAERFVGTRELSRPWNNFAWRGSTSYGKSTGVEQLACILNMPLLRMTCNSTMETQSFLSEFVPTSAADSAARQLPSFEEMSLDPESAYETLTGQSKENATGEDCLKAYADAVLAMSGGKTSFFKLVESPFVVALSRGYILEIQEFSRIRDSGVLVGLNEFDRPGAMIPLVDGGYTRRSKNALIVWTDNVGYASCRPVDPSVIRRWSMVIDSYDLPKTDVLARVVYNTKFADKELLDRMYEKWVTLQAFLSDKDITEGSCSVTELEMWATAVMLDGYKNLAENAESTLISKATSDRKEQELIRSSVFAI